MAKCCDLLHDLFDFCPALINGWDKLRHGPPMTGNGEAFATLDGAEQLGKVYLGFGRLNLSHDIQINRLVRLVDL